VIAEVRQAVDARITSVNKKSKFLKFAKRLIEAKEETDAIGGLDQKIQNVVVEFQVRMVLVRISLSSASVLMRWCRYHRTYASSSMTMISSRV
jgi:hypothetical protein